MHTPTEIADFETVLFVDEEVFRFDVPVYETLAMKKVKPGTCLYKVIESLSFSHLPHLPDHIEQVTLLCILKKQIEILTILLLDLECCIESDYVLMNYSAMNLNLSD